MFGPAPASVPMLIGSPSGASVSTSAARRPSNVLSPTPSNSTATATPAFEASSPSPASACSPPPHRTSRRSLSPWLPGPYWPEYRCTPPPHHPQNKTPPKIDGVCQRSGTALRAVSLFAFTQCLLEELNPSFSQAGERSLSAQFCLRCANRIRFILAIEALWTDLAWIPPSYCLRSSAPASFLATDCGL